MISAPVLVPSPQRFEATFPGVATTKMRAAGVRSADSFE